MHNTRSATSSRESSFARGNPDLSSFLSTGFIDEAVTSSRVVVEESVKQSLTTRKDKDSLETRLKRLNSAENSARPVITQLEEGTSAEVIRRIKQEEFVRRQHERTIEDLKNRMNHLEQELQGVRKEENPKEQGKIQEIKIRLETALQAREDARKECVNLKAWLDQLRSTHTETITSVSKKRTELEAKALELTKKIQESRNVNGELSRLLSQFNEKVPDSTTKLIELETKILNFEEEYEMELCKTRELQGKLEHCFHLKRPPHSQELLEHVKQQVCASEDQVLALEKQLETTEHQCERLKRLIVDQPHSTPRTVEIHRSRSTDTSELERMQREKQAEKVRKRHIRQGGDRKSTVQSSSDKKRRK